MKRSPHRSPTGAVVLTALVVLCLISGCARSNAALQTHLAAILEEQAEAWNAGDIAAYMDHYWNSGELTFSSGGETVAGWQATFERYQRRYPTPERMGELRFDIDRIHRLDARAAFVLGRWHLTRDDPIGGNFSVVFQEIGGRWLIVHDHTSVTEADDPQ